MERERTEQTNTNEAVRLWLDCSKDHLRKLRDQVVSMYDTLLPHKPPDQLYLIFSLLPGNRANWMEKEFKSRDSL